MRKLLAVMGLVAAVLSLATGVVVADQSFQDGYAPAGGAGGLVSDNGQIEWQISNGTYGGAILARYIPNVMNSVARPPAGSVWVGSPFNLGVYDADLGRFISTDRPMTLVVHYDPAQLGGRSESTLRVVRFYDRWVDFPSTVDTVRHTVTTQFSYSGDYGLLANDSASAPAPAAAPAPASAPAPAPAPAPGPAPAPAPALAPAPAPAPTNSSSVSGKVFYDKNGNGVMDGDDFPIGGAGLLITSGDFFAFTRAAADGSYSFSGLPAGTYTVNVAVGPEWAFTTPFAVSGISLNGQPGSTGTANFGLWYKLP